MMAGFRVRLRAALGLLFLGVIVPFDPEFHAISTLR